MELIEPFERELRRQPRIAAQRNDGFSQDGLSYSVANDFGKLWGQAMAEYDARTNAPRNDIYGETLEEDTPDSLRRQLLDPLTQNFGGASSRPVKTASPRTYKFGDQLVSVDPRTGATNPIYTAPAKPDTRGDSFDRQLILGNIATLRALQRDPLKLRMAGKRPEDIEAEIAALEEQGRKIYEPESTPVAAVPEVERPKPQIFMGDPLDAPAPQAPAKKRLIFNPQSGRLE